MRYGSKEEKANRDSEILEGETFRKSNLKLRVREVLSFGGVFRVPHGYKGDAGEATLSLGTELRRGNEVDRLVLNAASIPPSHNFVPGSTYKVKYLALRTGFTSRQCLELLRKENALLVGLEGLAYIYQDTGLKFPLEEWVVSFDDREHLFADDLGSARVPMMQKFLGRGSALTLGYFDSKWGDAHILLCVTKK